MDCYAIEHNGSEQRSGCLGQPGEAYADTGRRAGRAIDMAAGPTVWQHNRRIVYLNTADSTRWLFEENP